MKLLTIFLLVSFTLSSYAVKPNVLLIVVDDLRPSLKVYGDNIAYTPHINVLASKSFIFTNAFAQQALCAPSRNSFLTSRRPDSLHLYDFYNYWRETIGNLTTLPQFFKENGYNTFSIGKVFHPGKSSNYTDDFPYSWSEKPFHPATDIYKNAKVCTSPDGHLRKNLICPVIVNDQPGKVLPDQESTNEAIKYLEKSKNNSKPFFLAVGFHKPHIPFKFPIEYIKYHPLDKIKIPKNKYRPALLPEVAWNPWNDLRKRDDIDRLNISFPFGKMPDDITAKIIQSYHASLTYVDFLIGRILKKIDDNTIIVLLGDHGWSMGEHGEFSKFSNFNVAVKVPLLIKVPKLNEKQIIINELVELVDLFPSLVDLTGFNTKLKTCPEKKVVELCTEGKSLVPLMAANSLNNKIISNGKSAVFTQYPRPGVNPTINPDSDRPKLKEIEIMGYSIITKQFRYTLWVHFDNKKLFPNWKVIFGTEFYDYLFDPQENYNLAGRKGLSNLEAKLKNKLINGWRYAM